ncbi:hypothetical protein MARPO_0069s0049 [Marchantia polymorpha]|uniref:Uncharacterized protein n=1 Tax=Marchantia polymorpha TaxID=3197 RepID=A0A2R6WPC6_MARPO|nr:hypothetical protein MARPO_0069s0049 [Marchantia polymorpha]|eukprot:PTQ35710.1 hypothetical protein MARPO_0069s0049 [Marchantia polymorpha]
MIALAQTEQILLRPGKESGGGMKDAIPTARKICHSLSTEPRASGTVLALALALPSARRGDLNQRAAMGQPTGSERAAAEGGARFVLQCGHRKVKSRRGKGKAGKAGKEKEEGEGGDLAFAFASSSGVRREARGECRWVRGGNGERGTGAEEEGGPCSSVSGAGLPLEGGRVASEGRRATRQNDANIAHGRERELILLLRLRCSLMD